MRMLCAWCKQLIEGAGDRPAADSPVSHGICESCARLYEDFEPVQLGAMLDRFGGPVLLIDPRGQVVAVNSAATDMLGKEPADLLGKLGGEVIECVNSRSGGGCGETTHCTGCTIRRTVRETLETGESRWGVEAYQHVFTPTGVEHVRVLITTERWRDQVLLRIDAIDPARSPAG